MGDLAFSDTLPTKNPLTLPINQHHRLPNSRAAHFSQRDPERVARVPVVVAHKNQRRLSSPPPETTKPAAGPHRNTGRALERTTVGARAVVVVHDDSRTRELM